MAGRSSSVLSFIAGLCGLTGYQLRKLRQVVRVLGDRHPALEDDLVQEMALAAWQKECDGDRANIGDLIAAGNRAAAKNRRP